MTAHAVTLRLGSQGNEDTSSQLGETPLLAEHRVTQDSFVLGVGSCSLFRGGMNVPPLLQTNPAVHKLQTPTSSYAPQWVSQSSPPSRITVSTSLTAFLTFSLPPYEGATWVFFGASKRRLFTNLFIVAAVWLDTLNRREVEEEE